MNILAVDACPESLRDLADKLRQVFPEDTVAAFSDPLAALKFGNEYGVELLFTDVRLRPIDGYELVKVLLQKSSLYAYIVSGSPEKPDDFGWMNVNGCFTKPVGTGELLTLRQKLYPDAQMR